jgi:hypothetical protein
MLNFLLPSFPSWTWAEGSNLIFPTLEVLCLFFKLITCSLP